MSTQTYLCAIANSARQLLDCEQVSLCLASPDEALCHPLTVLYRTMQPAAPLYYGSDPASSFWLDEHFWALCDLSLLTGQNILAGEWLKQTRIYGEGDERIRSALIMPLERPAGIIGFLFCFSHQADAFKQGELRLLDQYRSFLAKAVEKIVSVSCLPTSEEEFITTEIQEKSSFLALVSHELRAPLMAIKGYTALLEAYGGNENQSAKMSKAQQQHYLATIMQQVKHLEVLIGDTLNITHLQAGHLTLRCTSLDIRPLFRHIVQSMQQRIEQQQPGRHYIISIIDPELPPVWADADRVQQVLTNLLENAIKYSPDGGLIELRASISTHCKHNHQDLSHTIPPSPAICISIRDQGIGIPRQQQTALFKPFTRLNHPATRHVNGSGLGLYIARTLVEAMHGQIQVDSSEGKGTDISFTLPLAPLAKNRTVCYSVGE